MTTLDYLINAALVLLVLVQVRERTLDRRSVVLPLVLVGVAAQAYLHSIPTAGNDLALIVGLALVGATLGVLCGIATHVRTGPAGQILARAGWIAALLWIAGIGARTAFVYATEHGAGHAVAHFSMVNHITGSAAWTAALVLMALCEVTARVGTIQLRARLLSRTAAPELAPAQA